MIGLDTNVLLRWLFRDDLVGAASADQADALAALFDDAREPFFVNEIVIAETAWVLRQRGALSKMKIAEIIGILLNLDNAVVRDRETISAALQSYAAHPGDFPDHLIGEINRRHGCRTTMTFDRAAAKSPYFTELRS